VGQRQVGLDPQRRLDRRQAAPVVAHGQKRDGQVVVGLGEVRLDLRRAAASAATATIETIDKASVGLSGPSSATEGQSATFSLSLGQYVSHSPSGSWEVVWGDGSQPASGPGMPPTSLSHAFTNGGQHRIRSPSRSPTRRAPPPPARP